MPAVRLYGLADSVYVRIARIALHEKGVDYTLEPTDVFDPATLDPRYAALHPFRRIPALDHDGFRLYETSAIARYIDENFPGPALQPADPRERARMNQIVSVVDSYAYPALIRQLVVERLFAGEEGRTASSATVEAGCEAGRRSIDAIAALADGPYLTGGMFTLADIWFAPIVAYTRLTKEGAAMLADTPLLTRWWEKVQVRPSVVATRYPKEG
ncbi:MAG: glutathione S-transferase family protein [Dongiaceae bacterium]